MRFIPLSASSHAIILGLLPAMAAANGYQNLHQSATGLGTAYSANGTGIDDISAIYSNPASLTRFPGTNASFGADLIMPRDSFENLSATTASGAPVTDGSPGTPTQFLDNTLSGYWYIGHQLSDQLYFGLSFNAPWATESDYTDTAASRYTATTTKLTAYNLTPMLAYKVDDKLSIAAGLNIQYYVSEFSTNISLTPDNPSQASDLASDFEGNDLSFGAIIGIEYQATDQWRFGASYRTKITHEFDGDIRVNGSDANLAVLESNGVSRDGDARYEIATPWMLQLGAHGKLTDRLETYASATLTGWSAFKDTNIHTTNIGDLRVRNGWDNAWYVAVGLGYQVNDKVKVFGGVAYDETPTPTEVRNPRAPNADRSYVGLGGSYEVRPGRTFKVGYAHTFFEDAPIRLTSENNPGRGTLNGDIKIDADILMVQYIHQF
ncbi:OmpP1/FadL family transporter [Paracoccus litorisediminis]|uniref:Outer membrane beta-barrel protein n=1 Tax=Paracoccus litorisediminis TaxID=2006130 RepID=A0A844HPI1_9RHOB|nr:outer membrane protein transport protein [Paracoccus litorisediminis]MTH61039.1 outer membrane beta-barrel protein [Paracoccus litorisediminis]